ncbi:MAG: TROVE domain-containing protein, partial [Helicobacteraceae bacterium]|nr:TROVE domain-containing protein [Helicobacteraceae bacterium]
MSKMGEFDKKRGAKGESGRVVNFMGGFSYRVDPLLTLEMVAASSIFGEPSYYRAAKLYDPDEESTTGVFIKAIDDALDYDFGATLKFAVKLREEYLMRLNPAVIMVRAAMHKSRAAFNAENRDLMSALLRSVIKIPTDMTAQFDLWSYFNGSKNRLPSILKRAWKQTIETLSPYHIAKYKTSAKLIDLIRICHAKSGDENSKLTELMRTGAIVVEESETTWEQLRSVGKSWIEILDQTHIPHQALLRNLRGIFEENNDKKLCKRVCEQLENGVEKGKQFPFRYWSALNAVSRSGEINHKADLIESLNRCVDRAIANYPKLKGKTICLSDNSGSATGTFYSQYGSVHIAEIGNLSSILTAINSDEGFVGCFGDRLEIFAINKRDGVLSQLAPLNAADVGGNTENGIWLFFEEAIAKRRFYDNIFIYSDMQAGRGELYGTIERKFKLRNESGYMLDGESYQDKSKPNYPYIDVAKLVEKYRAAVNEKVNFFSVQTAGYDNNVLPQLNNRSAILTG